MGNGDLNHVFNIGEDWHFSRNYLIIIIFFYKGSKHRIKLMIYCSVWFNFVLNNLDLTIPTYWLPQYTTNSSSLVALFLIITIYFSIFVLMIQNNFKTLEMKNSGEEFIFFSLICSYSIIWRMVPQIRD